MNKYYLRYFFVVIVFWLQAILCFSRNTDDIEYSSNVKPNMFWLLNKQKRKGIEEIPYIFVPETMDAIHQKKHEFEVLKSKTRDEIDFTAIEFEEITSQAMYNTSYYYKLHGSIAYYSLDEETYARAISEINGDKIVLCHDQSNVKVDDIFIASVHGMHVHSLRSSHGTNPNLVQYMNSPSVLKNKGFRLIRRVVSRNTDANGCASTVTEDVHPLELFDTFSIISDAVLPYSINYDRVSEAETAKEKRDNRGLTYSYFDNSGVIACDDTTYWSGGSTYSGVTGDLTWHTHIAMTYACAQFVNTIGDISMNYDATNKKASTASLEILSGVTCNNCYAYLGASFYSNIQYKFTKGFAFMVKVTGGAGYNVDIQVSNPSISSSNTVELLSASSTYSSIAIGNGLYLNTKFGGLTASLSGSCSASGTASFTASASSNAYVGMTYKSGSLTFPYGWDTTVSAPTYTDNLSSVTCSIDAGMIGAIDLQLSLSGTFAANFQVDITPYVTYVISGDTTSNGDETSGDTTSGDEDQTRRQLDENPPRLTAEIITEGSKHRVLADGNVITYSVGDTIEFKLSYTDHDSSSGIINYILYITNDNLDYDIPVQSYDFESFLESGEFLFKWIISSDRRFTDELDSQEWYFKIKGSNQPLNVIEIGDRITISDYLSAAATVAKPVADEVVLTNTYYNVIWDKSSLSRYVINDKYNGNGRFAACENVEIQVLEDNYIEDGDSMVIISPRIFLLDTPNTGNATIFFDDEKYLKNNRKYYINIECKENGYITAWSDGFFSFASSKEASSSSIIITELPREKIARRSEVKSVKKDKTEH